ncbi:hypothetical protein AAFN90_02935 [Erwiniaceae bacterium CAU 1747]
MSKSANPSNEQHRKEQDHPAKEDPREQGEIPRTPDNSDDDERDPSDKT